MSVTISGDTGVSKVQDGVIVQADLASGVAGNGPAFLARMSNTQSISSTTWTNVAFNQEAFDTDSCFNNTGSTVGGIPAYAFLPNVAGYYQLSAGVYNQNGNIASLLAAYKNGSAYLYMARATTSSNSLVVGSGLIYFNGTTDYAQIYFYAGGSTAIGSNDPPLVWFSGFLARAA